MQEHKYPTAFPLKHQQKDMRLALELALQNGQQLPTAAAANGLYEQVQIVLSPHQQSSMSVCCFFVFSRVLSSGCLSVVSHGILLPFSLPSAPPHHSFLMCQRRVMLHHCSLGHLFIADH